MERRELRFAEAALYPSARGKFIRYSHLERETPRSGRLLAIGTAAREKGLAGIEPRATLAFWHGSVFRDGELRLDRPGLAEPVVLRSAALAALPAGTVAGVWAYLVTAGECEWQDSDPVTSQLCADTWGTAYVDAARDALAAEVAREAEARFPGQLGRSLFLSDSWGPGFYSLPLSTLADLFALLDGEALSMCLTASQLLLPLKSCAGLYLLVTDPAALPPLACRGCLGHNDGCSYCRAQAAPTPPLLP